MATHHKRGRSISETIHHYTSVILAGAGIVTALVVGILPHTGLAERAEPIIRHSSELLVPIGVFLISTFYLTTLYGQREIADEVRQLREVADDPSSGAWQQRVKEALPANLRDVFSRELDVFFQGLRKAAELHQIELTFRSLEAKFIDAYRQTLARFAGSTFWSTALATKAYWAPFECLLADFKKFIDNRGAMNRLFFVTDPEKLSIEECEVMIRQAQVGVGVYVAKRSQAEADGQFQFFAVEESGQIEWEVVLGHDSDTKAKKIVATFDREEVRKARDTSKSMFDSAKRLSLGELEESHHCAKARAEKRKQKDKGEGAPP